MNKQQDATPDNNEHVPNPWHTLIPTAHQEGPQPYTWLYIYNRYLYLQHIITTQPQNTLEYQLRAHLSSWQTRAYLMLPLSQHQNVANITSLL
eukprot:3934502-Prorocentrum_lima.AAC.1